MFVSQWWLISWLLHFTRFAQSHFSSLPKSFWMTPIPSSAALHRTAQSHRQTCCGCTQSRCPTDQGGCILPTGICSLQMAWSDCISSLSLFPQEGLLQVQSTTDAYPSRIICAPALGGVFCWIHRPISFCLSLILKLPLLVLGFLFLCTVVSLHWYHMGRRDLSVTVYQIRAAETKGMW